MTDELFLRHVKKLIYWQKRLEKAHIQDNLSAKIECRREINMLTRSIELYIDFKTDKAATRL